MKINKISFILLLLIIDIVCNKINLEFQIRKRTASSLQFQKVGNIKLLIHKQQRRISGDVQPIYDQLITDSDMTSQPIILEFVCISKNNQQYNGLTYLTAVDQIRKQPHGQKISIIMGTDPQNFQINSINYIQTRDRVGQIYIEQEITKLSQEETFKYQAVPKKNQVQQQSFWTRYKWPLIIGGVLLFTMSSGAQQPAAQGARQ